MTQKLEDEKKEILRILAYECKKEYEKKALSIKEIKQMLENKELTNREALKFIVKINDKITKKRDDINDAWKREYAWKCIMERCAEIIKNAKTEKLSCKQDEAAQANRRTPPRKTKKSNNEDNEDDEYSKDCEDALEMDGVNQALNQVYQECDEVSHQMLQSKQQPSAIVKIQNSTPLPSTNMTDVVPEQNNAEEEYKSDSVKNRVKTYEAKIIQSAK